MIGKTTNPKLQKIEQEVASNVPPELQNAFQRIVTAGMTIMYAPDSRKLMLSQLSQKGDPAEIAGQGIAKLMGILYQKSKGTMPQKAAIPAAQILLCEGLDFMAQGGLIQITDDSISQATMDMVAYLLQIYGFKKEQIQQYIAAGEKHQAQQGGMPPSPGGIIQSVRGA